jgi:hypothetical protein
MMGNEIFQKQFDALDVTMRAALVFRYRENLPLAHVAQLVELPARRLAPRLDRTLTELRESGALDQDGSAEEALRQYLEERRDDPALSSFNLVRAVRALHNRRGVFWGVFSRRFA